MGNSVQASGLSANSVITGGNSNQRVSGNSLAASSPKTYSRKTFGHIESVKHCTIGRTAGHAASFLLKVVALELVRRFSRAKCPSAWHGLQALQLLCYPPFKWIERWAPFKDLIKGIQMLSRPLLVLSVATAFSDKSEFSGGSSDGCDDSDVADSHSYSEPRSELSSENSTLGTRLCGDGALQSLAAEDWMVQLNKELENEGITLPERIDKDELHRFYLATNGDFSCLLSSIKKTIRWRETYNILSKHELEMWSNMVFWHGFDVKNQPCLIVRLGLACLILPPHDRPRFAQVVVSQIEHGVVHLLDSKNPQITVLVDCEGLSPLKIPMQMIRSCSALLQDHFPNRLGCLFVIRLPPVVRVIGQTFIQVLKPITRQKLRIAGEAYLTVLSEYLRMIPSYLGGNCTCTRCSKSEENEREPISYTSDDGNSSSTYLSSAVHSDGDCNQILRTTVISILMIWIFFAIIAGLYDAENRQFLPP